MRQYLPFAHGCALVERALESQYTVHGSHYHLGLVGGGEYLPRYFDCLYKGRIVYPLGLQANGSRFLSREYDFARLMVVVFRGFVFMFMLVFVRVGMAAAGGQRSGDIGCQ